MANDTIRRIVMTLPGEDAKQEQRGKNQTIGAIEERREETIRKLRARAQLHAEAHLRGGRRPGLPDDMSRPVDLWSAKLLLQVAGLLEDGSDDADVNDDGTGGA